MNTTTTETNAAAQLAAIEEIKSLKYRYFRCLDQELFSEVEGCFTADGSIDYGPAGAYEKVADFVAMIQDYAKTNTARGVHLGYNPEITIQGDTATGEWLCRYLSVDTEKGVSYKQTGIYRDTYRLVDGEWRIATTLNEPLFNETTILEDGKVSVTLG